VGPLGFLVSFIMPVCAAASVSDSRFGLDLAHSTEFEATITKAVDQRWPSVQRPLPAGTINDAIARSWPQISATASVSGRLEAAPTLLVLMTIPFTGIVVDPGATAEVTASVGVGKQNVCGDLHLDARIKGWTVFDALFGVLTSASDAKKQTLWDFTRKLVSGHHFAGDPCDPAQPPQPPQPEPTPPTESPIPVAGSPATCPATPASDFSARGTQLGLNRSYADPQLEGARLQTMRPDAYAIDVGESRRQGFTLQQVIDDVDRSIASFVATRESAWRAAQEVAATAGLVEGLRRNGLPPDYSCTGGVGSMACLGTSMNWFIEYMIDLRKNAACYYP